MLSYKITILTNICFYTDWSMSASINGDLEPTFLSLDQLLSCLFQSCDTRADDHPTPSGPALSHVLTWFPCDLHFLLVGMLSRGRTFHFFQESLWRWESVECGMWERKGVEILGMCIQNVKVLLMSTVGYTSLLLFHLSITGQLPPPPHTHTHTHSHSHTLTLTHTHTHSHILGTFVSVLQPSPRPPPPPHSPHHCSLKQGTLESPYREHHP